MKFKSSLLVFSALIASCIGGDNDNNPYRHTEVLDKEGKYLLDWFADFAESRIYFNVTVQTTGYVGFGLSKKGKMLGADMVIGGVQRNGSVYFSDRHGVVNHQTEVDASQDWTLHTAWESKTHTFLGFSRPFETCDKANDLPIQNDVIALIWSYGERDNEREYHYQNRGVHNAYLLDPILTPQVVRELGYRNVTRPQKLDQLGEWKVWSIDIERELPTANTAYVCTYHKPPTKTKHHIVGFRSVMGEKENKHIPQFLLHICRPPKGVSGDVMFGRYLGHSGLPCYLLGRADNESPMQYCQEVRHVRAVGAEPIFFPDHVGLPLSENEDEYYMLQMHHDNPQEIPGIKLNFSLEAFYTDELRKYDGGMIMVGVGTPGAPSIIVPPSDPNHFIYGHCAADCTRKIIPQTGINVFAAHLHTRSTGKGMRVSRIHNLQETAIQTDDNYDFNFQSNRILRETQTILPGDMIVSRCIYDTTNRTRATVGGFRSRDERCNSYLWYYPLIRTDVYGLCTGELRSDAYRNFLKIQETDWSNTKREEVVISPLDNAGLTISEVASRIDWDINRRSILQTHQRFLPQVNRCPSFGPEAVTRKLVAQAASAPGSQEQDTYPLVVFLQSLYGRDQARFTELNKEIQDPGSEFVYLWPKDLRFYSPPTICPAN